MVVSVTVCPLSVTGFECTCSFCSKEKKSPFFLLLALTNVLLPFLSLSLLMAFVMFWRLKDSRVRSLATGWCRSYDVRSQPTLPGGFPEATGHSQDTEQANLKPAWSIMERHLALASVLSISITVAWGYLKPFNQGFLLISCLASKKIFKVFLMISPGS